MKRSQRIVQHLPKYSGRKLLHQILFTCIVLLAFFISIYLIILYFFFSFLFFLCYIYDIHNKDVLFFLFCFFFGRGVQFTFNVSLCFVSLFFYFFFFYFLFVSDILFTVISNLVRVIFRKCIYGQAKVSKFHRNWFDAFDHFHIRVTASPRY